MASFLHSDRYRERDKKKKYFCVDFFLSWSSGTHIHAYTNNTLLFFIRIFLFETKYLFSKEKDSEKQQTTKRDINIYTYGCVRVRVCVYADSEKPLLLYACILLYTLLWFVHLCVRARFFSSSLIS